MLYSRPTLRAGLALALGIGLAFGASAQPDTSRLGDRLDRLGERVSATSQQAAALDAVAARATPANSWTSAAQVLDVLTSEQVAQLREMRDPRGDRARGQRGDGDRVRGQRQDGNRARSGRAQQGRGARRGGRGGQRAEGRAQGTDAQRDAARAAREEIREQQQVLTQRLRDGSISDADYVTQSQALRERAQQQMAAAADARRDDRAEMRESAQADREQALGLTDAQEQRLQTLRLDRIRQAPERLDMRPYLDADGQLDRSAYREAQREQRQQARAAGQSVREQTAAVYTERQRDLMLVHRAISGGGRDGQRGRQGGRRGR